jgi:galactokinase
MSSFEAFVLSLKRSGELFDARREIYVGRAPGRLDVMGGNVDYTGGLVLQATIGEATWAAAQLRDDHRIVVWNPQMRAEDWQDRVKIALDEITRSESVRAFAKREKGLRWTAYVLGTFCVLREMFPEIITAGASVYIHSEVPLNKGVSSSAAVEVAVMKTVARAYGIDLQGIELAEACQWVENVIAESACGIMDQAAVVLGDEDSLLPLLCQPCKPAPLLQLPEGVRCWGIDSGVRHEVTGIEYERARAAAYIGYKLICDWEGLGLSRDAAGKIPRFLDARWNGYLSNMTPSIFRSRYETRLPEHLAGEEYLRIGGSHPDPFTSVSPGILYPVRACTRYAVEENFRIGLFHEMVRSSSALDALGDLMYQSHYSYTECGLGCEATDTLVELVRNEGAAHGLYGAKITGGGSGGTVAVLGASGGEAAFDRVAERYAVLRGSRPILFKSSSPGADRFGVRRLGCS